MKAALIESRLGRKLGPLDGSPKSDVTEAERRLGIKLPAALASFYEDVVTWGIRRVELGLWPLAKS